MVPIRATSFVPRSRSKVVFALAMGCYSIAAGRFMASWTSAIGVSSPPRGFYLRGDVSDAVAALIVAPLIESLMLAGVFELVRRCRAAVWAQTAASALLTSELHVWPWWPHAVIVLPSFMIQAAAYCYWQRVSWRDAYWMVVAIHAINNVVPVLGAVARATRHV